MYIFIYQGSVKLALTGPITAVLESDGTEIDDDDILEAVRGEILLLLQDGEHWTERTCVGPVSEMPATANNEPSPEPCQPVTPKRPICIDADATGTPDSICSRPSSPAAGKSCMVSLL